VQIGLITNDLYILVMDYLEFEVVGGTCGNPDRG
jgi:hypothetical protein